MKEILKKITSITLIAMFCIMVLPLQEVYAAKGDPEGPYTIILDSVNKEDEEVRADGAWFKLIKVSSIDSNGDEVTLEEPKLIIPEVSCSEEKNIDVQNHKFNHDVEEGAFQLLGTTTIIIPKDTGRGRYQLINVKRPPGYHKTNAEILIEFPEIENSEYTYDQTVQAAIKFVPVKAGFLLKMKKENTSGLDDIFTGSAKFKVYQTHTATVELQEPKVVEEFEYAQDKEVIVKGLSEGQYFLRCEAVSDTDVIKAGGEVPFEIGVLPEMQDEAELITSEYTGRDMTFEYKDLAFNLTVYHAPEAEMELSLLEDSEGSIKEVVSKNKIRLTTSIYLPGNMKNYDEAIASVKLPPTFKILSSTMYKDKKDINVKFSYHEDKNIVEAVFSKQLLPEKGSTYELVIDGEVLTADKMPDKMQRKSLGDKLFKMSADAEISFSGGSEKGINKASSNELNIAYGSIEVETYMGKTPYNKELHVELLDANGESVEKNAIGESIRALYLDKDGKLSIPYLNPGLYDVVIRTEKEAEIWGKSYAAHVVVEHHPQDKGSENMMHQKAIITFSSAKMQYITYGAIVLVVFIALGAAIIVRKKKSEEGLLPESDKEKPELDSNSKQ